MYCRSLPNQHQEIVCSTKIGPPHWKLQTCAFCEGTHASKAASYAMLPTTPVRGKAPAITPNKTPISMRAQKITLFSSGKLVWPIEHQFSLPFSGAGDKKLSNFCVPCASIQCLGQNLRCRQLRRALFLGRFNFWAHDSLEIQCTLSYEQTRTRCNYPSIPHQRTSSNPNIL